MYTSSPREIWDAALGELQVQVSKSNYRTWLEKTVGLEYQNNRFVVSVPNTFIAEYLGRNQRSLIEKTLINLTSRPDVRVTFQVNGAHKPPVPQLLEIPGVLLLPCIGSLNCKYSFDNFKVGKGNRLAYAAAQGVASSPGKLYNPLYIFGGVGLGKTHLLHAIGQQTRSNQVQVACISAEQYTSEFISALRNKKTEEFHHRYRYADMLLIDDIQFIAGKKQTEESFFHTFNQVHNAARQIVITGDQPPKLIPQLDKRLCSRFEWGLVTDIQPPDFDTRLSILQAKAAYKNISLLLEVLEFIARRDHDNVRQLEGSLNRVIAYARLLNAAPSIEIASQALENIGDREPTLPTTAEAVIDAVARSFNLTAADLKSSKRDKETSFARRIAMYLLRHDHSCSLAHIGATLGDRDPSAVTTACKKVNKELIDDSHAKHKIREIQKLLNSYSKQ
jgi:chromosomal replication initiator protein